MALGQISAQSFALPDVRIGGQPQQVDPNMVAQVEQLLPAAEQELDAANGLRSNYFNQYRQLKDFATSMAKRGIDVTRPDYSEPDGGTMYQSYLAMEGALRGAAQDLKLSKEIKDKQRTAEIAGTFRPVGNQSGVLTDVQGFNTQHLDTSVDKTLRAIDGPTYTKRDFQAKGELLKNEENRLRQAIEATDDPSEKARLQYNIDALVQSPVTTPYAAFQTGRTGTTKPPSFEIEILKNITNQSRGVWPEGTYKTELVEGEPALVSRQREGEQFGETERDGKKIFRIIDKWVKKPDGVYLYFKNADPMKASEVSGDALASSLISSNTKYGTANKMYASARELGLLDESSSAITNSLLPENAQEMQGMGQEQVAAAKHAISAEETRLLGDIVLNNSLEVKTPAGSTIKVKKHRNPFKSGFYVEIDGKEKASELEPAQALEWIRKNTAYFEPFVNQQAATPQAFDPTQF